MKRILLVVAIMSACVAGTMSDYSLFTPSQSQTPQPRLEVILAVHMFGVINENAPNDERVLAEAGKIFERQSLDTLREELNAKLNAPDELHRASQFDSLLKDIDKEFGKSAVTKYHDWLPRTSLGNANSMSDSGLSRPAQTVPWPLCVVRGC